MCQSSPLSDRPFFFEISRIQLEVDSSVLEQALRSSSMDFATSSMVTRDVRELLSDCFVCSHIINL